MIFQNYAGLDLPFHQFSWLISIRTDAVGTW